MLSPEEKQIVEYGKEQGKTPQESLVALSKYRATLSPTKPTVPEDSSGGNFITQPYKDTMSQAEDRLKEIGAQAASGEIGTASKYLQTAGTIASATTGLVFDTPVLHQAAQAIGWPVNKAMEFSNYINKKVWDAIPDSTKEALKPNGSPLDPAARKVIEDNTQAVLDMVDLGLIAVGGAAALHKVNAAVPKIAERVVANTKALKNNSLGFAKKGTSAVTEKIGDLVSKKISAPVVGALESTTAPIFDRYAKTAQEAALSNKAATPLELAGKSAEAALDTIQRKLQTIGKQKQGVLDRAAYGYKPVGNIATKFRLELSKFADSGNLVEGDLGLIKRLNEKSKTLGSNPTAKQVDQFIDYAQNELYTSKRNLSVPVTDASTGAVRQLVGQLNEALKAKLPESYRSLNQKYRDLIEVRNELNQKLGSEGEKGGALLKRVFSPSDAGTKNLFEEVLKITGVDLVNEATIAKFLMETVGDARQVSMLEKLQLPNLSRSSILQMALDFVRKKINTPEQIMKRARELLKEEG